MEAAAQDTAQQQVPQQQVALRRRLGTPARAVRWSQHACTALAPVYAFALTALGVQDMGNVHMFASLLRRIRMARSDCPSGAKLSLLSQTLLGMGPGRMLSKIGRALQDTKKHKKGKKKVGTEIRSKIVIFPLKVLPFSCFTQIGIAQGPSMPRRA